MVFCHSCRKQTNILHDPKESRAELRRAILYTHIRVHSSTIPNGQRLMEAQVINTQQNVSFSLRWKALLHTLQLMRLEDLCGWLLSLAGFPCSPRVHPGEQKALEEKRVLLRGTWNFEEMSIWGMHISSGLGMGCRVEGSGKQNPLKPVLLETCQIKADLLLHSRKPVETCVVCCVRPLKS